MQKLSFYLILFLTLSSFSYHQGLHIGEKAPDFKLKNIDGKMVSMSDFKDAKGFIVIFTCNHCPFSVKYENRIGALNKKYKKLGYPVIAINPNDAEQFPDESFENMKKRAKQKKFKFPYLLDDTQMTTRLYGATKTPDVFLLNKEGDNLILRYTGAIDDNANEPQNVKQTYLEDAVDALLANKPIEVPFTKAVGCSIKWKKR